jgi:TolB protein
MRKQALTLGLVAFVLAGVAATSSQATAPGKTGRIAFRRYFDNDHNWGAVFTISPNGKGERQITHPPKNTVDDQPDWAPDGSLIAFSRRINDGPASVYTIRPDGSALTLVSTCPPGGMPPTCSDDNLPTFSPDGRQIAFGSGHGERFDIVVADRDGGNQRIVARASMHFNLSDPQFSPSGKQLLFVRIRVPEGRQQALFVANLDGNGFRRLTPWSMHAGDNPDWSPDGKWILVRSNEDVDGKQSQIYVIHPNGSGLRQLTHFKPDSIVTSSSYSPDGRWIVFATNGVGGNADLFVMRPDGTGMHSITRTKLWDSAPDWGPAR